MEKPLSLIKKLNQSYKYVVYVALIGLVVAGFNFFAQDTSNAVTQSTPLATSLPESAPSLEVVPTQQFTSLGRTELGFRGTTQYANTVGLLVGITTAIADGLTLGSPNGTVAGVNTRTGNVDFEYAVHSGGALSGLVNLTGALYQEKPASVEVWAQDILERIDPVAYAQENDSTYYPGDGQRLLAPIQKLWRAATNIVYIFYILIMVLIAFLIVLRNQIGGDQVISLFNAIPSIIISLVLVYFSYPLSAVFIDVITLGSGVVYGVLIGTGEESKETAPGGYLRDDYRFIYNPDFYQQIVTENRPTEIRPEVDLQIDDRYVSVWNIFITAGLNPSTQGADGLIPRDAPLASIISGLVRSFTDGFLGSTLLSLVFAFAAFTGGLKLFFKLLQEYVVLMAYPIAAPFLFLTAAIPGRTGAVVSSYFRRLLSAAVAFILVYALFLLIIIIARSGGDTSVSDLAWVPPLLGYSDGIDLSGQQITSIARPLLAFALFLGIPPILDQVQNIISEPQNNPIGGAIVQSAAGAASGVYASGRQVFGFLQGQIMK